MTNQPGEIATQGRDGPGSPHRAPAQPDAVLAVVAEEPTTFTIACGHCPLLETVAGGIEAQRKLTDHLVTAHNLRRHAIRCVDVDLAELVTMAAPPKGRVL